MPPPICGCAHFGRIARRTSGKTRPSASGVLDPCPGRPLVRRIAAPRESSRTADWARSGMVSVALRVILTIASAAMLAGGLAGQAEAFAGKEPIKLTPHRAVYEVTLDDARSASGITGIDGRMVFEFTGSECDGYTLNMRMVTQMTDSQGQTNLTDLRSSTWEEAKGQKFRFQSAQYLNDKLGDVTMGRATRTAPDTTVQVNLTQPNHAELDIPAHVLFPTQHSFALIDAAQEGQRLFQAKIYDGSEKGQRVYDTTAFIGKPISPGTDQGIEAPAKDK